MAFEGSAQITTLHIRVDESIPIAGFLTVRRAFPTLLSFFFANYESTAVAFRPPSTLPYTTGCSLLRLVSDRRMVAQPAAFQLDGGDSRLGNHTQGIRLPGFNRHRAMCLVLFY